MTPVGIKTSESDKKVTSEYLKDHIQIGIDLPMELKNQGLTVKHLRFD